MADVATLLKAASIGEALTLATGLIESDSPRLDAELLLANVLDVERSYFFTWPEKPLANDQSDAFAELLRRRLNGEPVAHILGQRGFWSLQLAVNPSTLIPRPDTEIVVETILSRYAMMPINVIDVGTGTGAIALALKVERPQWSVFAADFNADACRLAQQNAYANQLNVPLFCGSWLQAVAPNYFDLVVSNPPYIDAADPHLSEGDVRFEPHSALVADEGGLADLRIIAEQSLLVLKIGGRLVMEHGYDQHLAVQSLLARLGYDEVESVQDYGSQWRVTMGVKAV